MSIYLLYIEALFSCASKEEVERIIHTVNNNHEIMFLLFTQFIDALFMFERLERRHQILSRSAIMMNKYYRIMCEELVVVVREHYIRVFDICSCEKVDTLTKEFEEKKNILEKQLKDLKEQYDYVDCEINALSDRIRDCFSQIYLNPFYNQNFKITQNMRKVYKEGFKVV